MALAGAMLACGTALAVPAGAGADGAEHGQRMLASVNDMRAQHGLAALRGSGSLDRSARGYARWMLRADYFGHLGEIRASGRFSMLGETLAWHAGRSAEVSRTVQAWMHSPPHRALILHPGFRWLGAGMAQGRLAGRRAIAWVLHLGGPLGTAGAPPPAAGPAVDQLPSEARILSAPTEIASTTLPAGAALASAAP
jgi:uncharacterized protein YkwD